LQGVSEARAPANLEYPQQESETNPLPGSPKIGDTRENIVEKLGSAPVTVDELVRECQLFARIVQGALLELELAGRIERHPGNRISLLL